MPVIVNPLLDADLSKVPAPTDILEKLRSGKRSVRRDGK